MIQILLVISTHQVFQLLFYIVGHKRADKFKQKEDNLNATDDRESSQESHGSSNETERRSELDFHISFNLIKGCRVKVDLDQLQFGWWHLLPFEICKVS